MRFFETRFLKEVDTFFEQLDKKVVVKKTQKTPKAEIDRALTLRSKYFDLS
jgi:phage-related protein